MVLTEKNILFLEKKLSWKLLIFSLNLSKPEDSERTLSRVFIKIDCS